MKNTFHKGDVLVVTGDEASWYHELCSGVEVRVERRVNQEANGYSRFYIADGKESGEGYVVHVINATDCTCGGYCDGETRDVAVIDLERVAPTDEEIAEVYRILGVTQ